AGGGGGGGGSRRGGRATAPAGGTPHEQAPGRRHFVQLASIRLRLRSHESRSRTCRNSIICTSIVIKTIRVIYRSLDRYGYATTLEPNGRLGATPTFKHPNPATCLKARQGKPNEESSHVCWRGSVTARRDLAIDRVRAG